MTRSGFAALTKSEPDGKHPASHYLVVEDPTKVTTWHLRYRDAAGKLDNRLLGACHAALLSPAGYRGQKYQGPDKQKAITRLKALYKQAGLEWPTAKMSDEDGGDALFALGSPRRDGDYIVRSGKLFEGGDYPDKRYWMTPDELEAAVADFAPVPVDLEHQSTVLDGQLGTVRSLSVGDDGWSLHGEVALPAWLDPLLEGSGRKVSAMWDTTSKKLTGLALVNVPRISDAALMAAFAAAGSGSGNSSRHDTYDGQRTIQTIHDMAAKGGALCDPANPNGTRSYSSSYFVSSHERTGLQAVHDAATAHGAECSKLGSGTSVYAETFAALFAGQRHSASDAKDIQAIHDLARGQGADCAPASNRSGAGAGPRGKQESGRSGKAMAFNWKFWEKTTPVERAELREAGVEVPAEATFSEIEAQVEARMAEERAKDREALRKERATRLQAEAAFKADELIRGGKLTPPEREQFIAFRVHAALEDTEKAATFADKDGKQTTTSRVAAFDAIYEARPNHGLFREYVDPGTGEKRHVLMNQTAGAGGDPNDISTPAGAAAAATAWAKRQGNGNAGGKSGSN